MFIQKLIAHNEIQFTIYKGLQFTIYKGHKSQTLFIDRKM